MLDWYLYPLMIIAGFAAGFINTLAGSGSIVTLPLFLYLGLPANIANATNRINVIFQNITGAVTFHRGRMLDIRAAAILGIPSVMGSILGAMIAVSLDEKTMRMVIGFAMVLMAILILFKSDRWLSDTYHGRLRQTEMVAPGADVCTRCLCWIHPAWCGSVYSDHARDGYRF